MSEFWSNARPWLIWPWRAVLVLSFAFSLYSASLTFLSATSSGETAALLRSSGLLISLGFCVLLVVRGYRSRTALMLAVIMLVLGFGEVFSLLDNASFPSLLKPLIHPVQLVIGISYAFILPVFCMEVSGGPYDHRQAWLVRSVATAMAAALGAFVISFIFLQQTALTQGIFDQGVAWMILANHGFCYAIIAANYSRNDASSRNRLKIIILALVLNMSSAVLVRVLPLGSETLDEAVNVTLLLATVSLLAYAVLKQRLVDMGFAVNRTLVYGAAAFTLLVTFGLVEYIAKSMIPVAWPTAGPFISAGIAVLLFLMFHRLHHWFEHHIERLFFSSWQRAEAALKRFVHSAGHYEQVPALCRDFTGELERFSGGAAAALYLRGDSGGFELQAGELPGAAKNYAEDGRGFALMRTERKPIDLARADHPLPGALALPMLDQGRLLGFALVGAKPDGAHYRPDEIENLNWAVHQVGLDIRALHARLLEERVEQLAEEVSSLTNERDRAITDRDRVIGALANERLRPSGT